MLKPKVKTHPWLICLVYFVFLMPPILKSKACQICLQNTQRDPSSRVYHYHPWPSQHYHSAKLQHPGWAWPVHLLPCFCVCVLVTQSCPTLCDPMDCSSLGSAVHTVLQARILEWIAIPLSRESSQPRYRTRLLLCKQILYPLSHQGSPGFHTCPPQIHSSDGSQSDF